MLSRVADALFWMARYVERAENTARLIDVNFNMMLDMGHVLGDAGSGAPYWNPIIRITSPFASFREAYPKTTQESAIEWLTFGATNPNSILACVRNARENARAIRGSISSEMWEHINTTYLQMQETNSASLRREGALTYFRDVRMASATFQGLAATTMPRDEGWQWMQVGKYLERADATTRLLDVKYHILLPSIDEVGGPIDNVQWIAVLKSCSSYEAYQRRYVARITPSRVAEFLVLDKTFPRSVRFCFDQMHWALRSVGNEHGALG
ncbi:MAG TPA: alpha-E domain-containing protein, partial [Abditibacteriaceae bacterium]